MTNQSSKLREGYTTGSTATAAAMAALRHLLGHEVPARIKIPLPVKGTLEIPVEKVEIMDGWSRAIVVKDGGDDPDATHGEEIHALVRIHADSDADSPKVDIHGGKGVGRVTLPGLPVAVGEAAINPVPRKQIIAGILQEIDRNAPDFKGRVEVRIEVPNGELIAEKTMNARLGILGGISILGTQGIVRPFSHASWKASIAQALNVARAAGFEEITFTTGRRSDLFFVDNFPDDSQLTIVQAADFFKFSMQQAALKNMKKVRWSIFIGKLVKHAQGYPYTHAKDWAIDFPLLANWCAALGFEEELQEEIRGANTASQVFGMISGNRKEAFIKMLVSKAQRNALNFTRNKVTVVEYKLFDFEGNLLT